MMFYEKDFVPLHPNFETIRAAKFNVLSFYVTGIQYNKTILKSIFQVLRIPFGNVVTPRNALFAPAALTIC